MSISSPVLAERVDAVILDAYEGSHQDYFRAAYDRIRLLSRQAQMEASARLGLIQYQSGFQYPLIIRFTDEAPYGAEHALAFVQLGQLKNSFAQQLVVNLPLMSETRSDVDQVFRHEMTHAVLNDAVGGEASMKIPHWVQEGLAQYVSGEGDGRVRQAAGQFDRSASAALLCNLNGGYSGRCYPQYYLAIKYLYDRYSSTAVESLTRDLIAGKPIDEAIRDTTGAAPERFEQDVRDYSLKVFRSMARSEY